MTLKASMTAVAAAAAVLGLAACGGSSKAGGVVLAPSGGPTNTTISTVTAPATTSTTTPTTPTTVSTPKTGPLSKEPTIALPKGAAPTTLKVTDLIKGTGTAAANGDTLYVNYVGELYKNGKVFDASWKDTPGQTFSFVLGQGHVIPGWDKGLLGMKAGGRRELIIPPALAYKSQKQATIPPNSTLIFVVDLVKVKK
jgi:peptidylprolyl isomerase